MFLPSTVDELEHNAKYIVSKPDFVEVATKSMMYADAKGAYPIFVMPGFRPNNMKKLYRNLGYPTFEARYPENIASIKSVAEVLVNVSVDLLFVQRKIIYIYIREMRCLVCFRN